MEKTIKKALTHRMASEIVAAHTENNKHTSHMRTKTLLLTAALTAAGAVTSMAQVYSANAVGYVNLSLPTGFSMIANQLNASPDNRLDNIIPSAPDGTVILTWDSVNQRFNQPDTFFTAGPGWFDSVFNPSTTQLNPGGGAFINLPTPTTLTLVGEVPQGNLSQNIPQNFSIVSQLTPQALGFDASGFPADDGDNVLFYNNAQGRYNDPITYFSAGPGWFDSSFNPQDPTPAVGESVFVNKVTARTWNRSFSVN